MVIVVFSCVWCVSLVDWKFDVLLVLISVVNLEFYIPCFTVGWRLGAVRLE